MDKLGKKIMKYCRSQAKDTDWSFSLEKRWDRRCNTQYSDLLEACRDTENNVQSAIKWLVDNKYLEYDVRPLQTGTAKLGVKLTYKGLHQKEFEREKVFDTVIKSVLLPIIVTIFTTIIMNLGGGLWKLLS